MEDLDKLCEIGPVQTQGIIDGPYNKIEDLMKVKGIRGASLKRSKPT